MAWMARNQKTKQISGTSMFGGVYAALLKISQTASADF